MFNGIEESFILEDVKLFREFDVTNFVSNAKASIGNKIEKVNVPMKIDHYKDVINKSIHSLNNTILDPKIYAALTTFSRELLTISDNGSLVKDVGYWEFTISHPNALKVFTANIQKDLAEIIDNGAIDDKRLAYYQYGGLLTEFKKYALDSKAVIPDIKKWAAKDSVRWVASSPEYVNKTLLPFIKNFTTLKNMTIKDAQIILQDISEMSTSLHASLNAVDKMKREGVFPPDKIPFINMVMYNVIRGMLEIMSFMTFAIIRRSSILVEYAMQAERYYASIVDNMNVHESAFDNSILPLDSESLLDDFMNGEAGAFIEVSQKIYEFHHGDFLNHASNLLGKDGTNAMLNFDLSQEEYDKKPYKAIFDIFTEISAGLDKIGRKTDDVFFIKDDIVSDAGFDVKLYDRFANTINMIENLTEYEGSSNIAEYGKNEFLYQRMLAEIKEYGQNMSELSKNCAHTKRKLHMLLDRFNKDVNGEFKDIDTVHELKIFLSDLSEQYEDIVRSIVKKFIIRLKKLGDIIADISFGSSEEDRDDYIVDEDQIPADFSEMAFESIIEEFDEETEEIFGRMNEIFFYGMESYLYGSEVMVEADDTKVSVQDNSTGTVGNAIANVQAKISQFIRNATDKFSEFVGRQGTKNIRWLDQNMEELQRRSYSNVTVNILPYNNMSKDNIIKDIRATVDKIRGLQVSTLSNWHSEDDVLRDIIPAKDRITSENLKDGLEKYYKVGTGDLKTQPVSNSALKTAVTGEYIPFVKDYYTNFKNELSASLQDLGKVADEKISTLLTTSNQGGGQNSPDMSKPPTSGSTQDPNAGSGVTVGATTTVSAQPQLMAASANDLIDSLDMFIEADNVSDTTKTGNTNQVDPKIKSWISKAVKTYAGAILNACRDRANDYMKVLDILTPKTTNSVNRTGSPIETTGNQQQPAQQPQQ